MMTRIGLGMWSMLIAAACTQATQSGSQAAVPQAQDAARGGVATLQQLVTDQNYREMGFDSRDEVTRATTSDPWTLFNITLDQLKRYQPGADANALLTPSADVIVPVTVNNVVKSSITVTKGEGGYKVSSFGNAPIVKALARYRQSPGDFVVRVPALNMYYVGSRVDNRLMLTPIIDDTRLKAPVGTAVPAEQLLEQLARIANTYNGLPL